MTTTTIENSFAKRLKAATGEAHEGVDRAIMSAATFESREHYAAFLRMQYLFHRDIYALYDDRLLQGILLDLADRRRLALVQADLADLGLEAPIGADAPIFATDGNPDMATALGWLYVAEGSNMGAALLRKEVMKIGLSDDFGGRHLAPAPEGPAAHWRAFVVALDAADLTPDDEARAVAGARSAFARVQAHVDACFG